MSSPEEEEQILRHPLFAQVLLAMNDVDGDLRNLYGYNGEEEKKDDGQSPQEEKDELTQFLLDYMQFLNISRLHINRVNHTCSDYDDTVKSLLEDTMQVLRNAFFK